jgi:hypothetical protein
MATPTFLAGGNTPNRNDTKWFIQQRILGALKDGSNLSGAGVPDNSLGNNGDVYVNTINGDIYTKSGGTWAITTGGTGPAGGSGAVGAVDPEGVVTAAAGTTYVNSVNHSFWLKEAGVGNTGWIQYIG